MTEPATCSTCGRPVPPAFAVGGRLCPTCLFAASKEPVPSTGCGELAPLTGWKESFPQLRFGRCLRDEVELQAWEVEDHDRNGRTMVLQVISGGRLDDAGGSQELLARANRLLGLELREVAKVVDAADLSGAFFLLTQRKSSWVPALEQLSTVDPERLAKWFEQAAFILAMVRNAGCDTRLDLRTAYVDPGTSQIFLTPSIEPVDHGSELYWLQARPPAFMPGPGVAVGSFILEEKVGEGGFGEVWRARQERPVKRQAAIKVLKHGVASPRLLARFEVEQQALARLDHPHIANFYDGDTTSDGRPFFAMEWIDGESITDYSRHAEASLTERLRLFHEVCEAVEHAHQRGIIHRDLKSSNVMVTREGGASAKVIDFGIARALEEPLTDQTLITRSEETLGTPATMSPEQARGGELDARTDVYGLGALLYELLAGDSPFDTTLSSDELRRRIREIDPPRPSSRIRDPEQKREVRGDLDWITIRCLEKEPGRRYPSVGALLRDLERHDSGQAVDASPQTFSYRLGKFVRRNKGLVLLSAVTALILAVAAIVSTVMAVAATRAESVAEERLREVGKQTREKEAALRSAEDRAAEARWNQYVARQLPITLAWRGRDFGRLSELLSLQVPGPGEPDFRGWEWSFLQAQLDRAVVHFDGHAPVGHPTENAITVARKLPGGSIMIELRSAENGELLRTIVEIPDQTPDRESILSLCWSDDGERLGCLTLWGRAIVFSGETGETLFSSQAGLKEGMEAGVRAFDLSLDGKLVATGTWSGHIQVWDVDTGEVRVIQEEDWNSNLRSVRFSPDSKYLAAALRFGRRTTWDLESGEPFEYERRSAENGEVVWNRSGTTFASLEGNSICIRSLQQEQPLGELVHRGVNLLLWMGDGHLASMGYDRNLKVWDVAQMELIEEHQLYHGAAGWLAATGGGRWLALAAGGQGVKVVDRGTKVEGCQTLDQECRRMESNMGFWWSPDGRRVVSFHTDLLEQSRRGIHATVLDSSTGTLFSEGQLGRFRVVFASDREPPCRGLTFDGRLVEFSTDFAGAAEIGVLSEEASSSGKSPEVGVLAEEINRSFLSCSPDGRWLASMDGTNLRVIDASSGRVVRRFPFKEPVFYTEWGPDSRLLAVGGARVLSLIDPFANRRLGNASGPDVDAIAWAPDGKNIAVGGEKGDVKIYRVEPLKRVDSISVHRGSVTGLDWSSNGRFASSSVDGTVRIYDDATGDEVLAFEHPEGLPFRGVKWDPRGRRLAAGDSKGRVFIWGSEDMPEVPAGAGQLRTGAIAKDPGGE